MIQQEGVAAVLRPWLGTAFVERCDVCERLCEVLNGFDGANGDFDALSRQLDGLLFRTVHEMTEGDMRVLLDDRRLVRVRVEDIRLMADEVLYLRLHELLHSPRQMQRLREYALTHDSLSALRALYVDFAAYQSPEERAMLARVIRRSHPAFRWRTWLPADESEA